MQSQTYYNIVTKNDEEIKSEKEFDISFHVVEGNATRDELVRTFTMSNNEYLKCKWNHFLEHIPEETLTIKSYFEFKKKKDPIRKMILNGSFYLRSGELIPVPKFE